MEALKALFAGKALTYEELMTAIEGDGEKTVKLANLKDDNYVSKAKYQSLEDDSKKKLDEVNKQLEEAKKQTNPSEEQKAQIEQLAKDKESLETSLNKSKTQLDRLSKRELAVTKTGITNPDFLDLMLMRHGDKEIADFEKEVVTYAEANKQWWGHGTPSPSLEGEPQGGDDAQQERINKAMGVKEK